MATTIAKYKFDNESAYRSALERIRNEVDGYGSNWDSDPDWKIIIFDTCEKAGLIGQICRALGGTPYNY